MTTPSTFHILWIRTDSIGDNVLSASTLGAIYDRFKAVRITVLCQEHIAELYAPCPFVSHVITFNKALAYTDAHYREVLIRRIQALNIDIAMNSVYSRELICDIFATRSGARQRVGFLGDLCNIDEAHRSSNNCYYTALLPSSPKHRPEIHRHADFLRYFGIEADRLNPTVWTTPEDERFADDFFDRHKLRQKDALAVAPGSQNDYKIYPFFSEALKKFTDFKLILLGGMDTTAVSGEIFEKFSGTSYNLTGKTTLRQMAAIIRRCRLLLSSDSAAAHMAAAVGTKNVVVLGGGHFGRFFPYSELTTAVSLPLECYGCDWRCRFAEKYCISAIAPELVAWAVETSLRRNCEKPRLIAQGNPLWSISSPRWKDAEEFLNAAQVEIETFNELPEIHCHTGRTVADFEPVIATNKTVGAIVERLQKAASSEERQSLYASYIERIPYDVNAVKALDSLRLDIMKRQLPKISIVTPSFNQGAYLEQCILSIVTQGYPNLEYIIMDGGSTDNSTEIIKKYAGCITYSKSAPDAGQYAAIDEGLKRSTGEIMGWLNSDDKLHAGALWIAAAVFRAHGNIDWIMGRPTVWDADGTLSTVLNPIPVWSRKMYLDGFIGPPHIQQESTFWRRRLWDAAGGYIDTTLRYAGDMELWARFFRTADLYSVDALIGGIRNHPEQKTAKPAADGSGYYDYGDYNSEADVIVAREAALYNESPVPIDPPHAPVSPAEVGLKLRDSIRPENFSCFMYSQRCHSAYFNNSQLSSIDDYRCGMTAAFAMSNLSEGGRILIAGTVHLNDALANLTDRYEIWALSQNPDSHAMAGFICIKGALTDGDTALPRNYFDLAIIVEPDAEACNRVESLIKTGACALFFFDAALKEGDIEISEDMSHVISSPHAIRPFMDMSCLRLDPGALRFDGMDGRKILSYNVLWKKIQCETLQPPMTKPIVQPIKRHTPRISVIIIAHHRLDFIKETLIDLKNQTIFDSSIELLVVSTGNSLEYIKEVRIHIDNTVFIDVPEESSEASLWNLALKAASGEFVVHLPIESRLAFNAIETMSQALVENPDAAVVYGNTYLTRGANESFDFHNCSGTINLPDSSYERLLVDLNIGSHPMWRRAVHDEIGYIDKDIDCNCERSLWLKIAERHRIMHIPVFTGLMSHSVSIGGDIEEIQSVYQKQYIEGLRRRLASAPNVPVYVWGSGRGGHKTYDILKALDIAVAGFIDANPAKRTTKVRDLDVISPDEIISKKNESQTRPFVVISSMYDSEIRPILEGWGYEHRKHYWTNIFRFQYIRKG